MQQIPHKSTFLRHTKNVIENSFFFLLLGLILIIPSVLSVIYKSLIRVILKIKHGRNFYGMMDGDETIWALQEKSLGQIMTMFVHTYDEERNGDVLEAFRQQVDRSEDLKRACPKLFCRRGYFMGYYYFFADFAQQLTKEMAPYDSVEDLRLRLCEYGSGCEPLGEHGDGMMQLLIGRKDLRWERGAERTYPVIVRTHHSLGDGVSLNCLFIKELMKNPREFLAATYKDMVGIAARKDAMTGIPSKDVKSVLECARFLYSFLGKERYAPPILRAYDRHVLHGRSLSGRKNLVWNRDVRSEYVRKVKDVKNALDGASFNSVLLAAIGTTFNEYFLEKSPNDIPEVITSSLVTLPEVPKFDQMVKIDSAGNICDIDMTNKYVVCALKVPMEQTISEWSTVDKVNLINKEIQLLKKSLDVEVIILCNRVIAKLLPAPLVKRLMRVFNTTFGISNLPGFARGQLWHGGYIQDLYFWIPNTIDIGIGISIFSSNGRLEMGLIADTAIMPDLGNTQRFLDRIVHHIDEMARNLHRANIEQA